VLLDTFVVRPILVPTFLLLLARRHKDDEPQMPNATAA